MNAEKKLYKLINSGVNKYATTTKRKKDASDIVRNLRDLVAGGARVPRSLLVKEPRDDKPDWDWVRGVDVYTVICLRRAVRPSNALLTAAREAKRELRGSSFEKLANLDFEGLGFKEPLTLTRDQLDDQSRARYGRILLALILHAGRNDNECDDLLSALESQLKTHSDCNFPDQLTSTAAEESDDLADILNVPPSDLQTDGTRGGVRGLDISLHALLGSCCDPTAPTDGPPREQVARPGAPGGVQGQPLAPSPGGGVSPPAAVLPASAPGATINLNIMTTQKRIPNLWPQATTAKQTSSPTDGPRTTPTNRDALQAALIGRLNERHRIAVNETLPQIVDAQHASDAQVIVTKMWNAIVAVNGGGAATKGDDDDSARWLQDVENLIP